MGVHKGISDLAVDRWPDKENRTDPEIDAIAGKFAIEHTSIDSVMDQRKHDDWYLKVVEGLSELIKDNVDCGLTITLDFYAIGKGMDWNIIRCDLQNWIRKCAPHLAKGKHKIILTPTTEFPIEMHIEKGLPAGIVGFSRFVPKDNTLSEHIRRLLDRKAKKLRKYKGRFITILLVENNDIALMSMTKMVKSLCESYSKGLPQGVDELWYADTAIPNYTQFHNLTADLQGNEPRT